MDEPRIYHRTTETTYTRVKKEDGSERELHFNKLRPSVPGSAKVKGHSVSLMPDFVPKKLKPYRTSIALQEVNKQINDLLQLGLIESSESEWAHPIVYVPKKDGRSIFRRIVFRQMVFQWGRSKTPLNHHARSAVGKSLRDYFKGKSVSRQSRVRGRSELF
ncbi:hypothetical protein TNCV_3562881 [Trichonephila clavipes]|nr:hypothetical protein TNCV_3562881 [Trichonephila clavipes]